MKNRYLVFAGDQFYPLSNCRDFKKAFDDNKKQEAVALADRSVSEEGNSDWACVFDIDTLSVIHDVSR